MAPAGVSGDESDAGAAHFDARGGTAERQAADAGRVAPGALRDAAASDRADDIERLLAAGAHPDDPDGTPGTALLTAVAAGAPRATRALLAAGASVEVLCPVTRGNAAHAAARSPDPECAAQVIQACGLSFSRNHADHVRKSTLGLGERKGPNQDKKRVFSLDARDREGRTPLEVAFSRQKSARRSAPTCSPPDVAAASSTLENKPERVSSTKKTNTKTSGAYRVARALLDAGASPSARFAGGASPLAAAVAGGAAELCELLLERGADPDDGGALFDLPSPSRAEEGVETDDVSSATFDARGTRAEHESEKQNATCALASPALVAVRHSRADLLRLLVDQGADADSPAPCASGAFAPAADAAVAGGAASHVLWAEAAAGDSETHARTPRKHPPTGPSVCATPLQLACSLGELACVSTLLAAGADPGAPAEMPPLVCAAAGGSAEVVTLMLDAGAADPWACDARGATALHYAAARGHAEAVRALAAALAEVEADEDAERAARDGSGLKLGGASGPEETEYFDKRRKEKHGRDSLESFAESARRSVRSLMESLRVVGETSRAPRRDARVGCESDAKKTRAATQTDVSPETRPWRLVDAPDTDGQTALYAACAEGQVETVAALLDAGASVEKRFDPHEASLLHVAAAFDRAEVVRMLCALFQDPDLLDARGRTPLTVAAAAGAAAAAEALLAAGVDPDGIGSENARFTTPPPGARSTSRGKESPILAAARNGDFRLVQLLAARGADARDAEALGAPVVPTARAFRAGGALEGHAGPVRAVQFHPSDPAIAATAGADGAARVYRRGGDDDDANEAWTLGVSFRCHDASSGGATHVAWSGAGDRLLTSGFDGRCCVWSLPKTQKAPSVTVECDAAVTHAAWAPGDAKIVAATGDALSFCDARSGKRLATLLTAGDHLTRCAFATFKGFVAAAGVVSSSEADVVTLWDAATGMRTARVVSKRDARNSSFEASKSETSSKHFFSRRTPRRVLAGGCHLDSDDSRLVTCGADGLVRVWDTRLVSGSGDGDAEGRELTRANALVAEWVAHARGGVADAVFSPDGRLVATASADGTCALWDVRGGGGVSVCALRDPSNVGFGCCAFAGDGWTFAAGTRSAPEETLHSRGINLAVVWEGVDEDLHVARSRDSYPS
jgi:ankyrin repeat protein/WD40 repeat protein